MPHTTARNTEPARKLGHRWAWGAVWLLLAGILGFYGLSNSPSGAPTPVNQSSAQSAEPVLRTKPIEQVQLGERLSGLNPLREEVDPGEAEPDPATWRRVELRLVGPGGHRAEIEFLWPPEYLEATGATVGGWVELDMPEVGAVGQAEVLAIGPCPSIPPGTGPIVTGRFVHQSDGPALNVHVEGLPEPIGCTANHPFWSEDRQQFVEAGHLRPGEHVRTHLSGVVPITCITPRPSAPLVYNLQVHGEHVYEVSELGVLVHNKHVPKRVGRAPSGTAPKTVAQAPKKPVIIGETMARVEAAAAKTPGGAKILNDMPEFWNMGLKPYEVTSRMMEYNRRWIYQQLKDGRRIIDIGADSTRKTPSIFYQMEQNMLKNYEKLHPGTVNVTRP